MADANGVVQRDHLVVVAGAIAGGGFHDCLQAGAIHRFVRKDFDGPHEIVGAGGLGRSRRRRKQHNPYQRPKPGTEGASHGGNDPVP
jgi:hypothetical protein